MAKKELVLIGAGKIGRGYMADIFNRAGYKLTFLEYSEELVKKLNAQGSYTVFMSRKQERDIINFQIGGYTAYCTETEREACLQAIAQTNYVTVHVYPGACESIGHLIGDAVKLRMEQGNTEPLDILTCVNFQDPANIFRGYALERMETEAQRQFLEEHVGFVETLIFRNGGIPTPEMLAVDPICVSASDNTHWPVDKEAFKGCPPEGIEMDLQDNFAARLCYKVWAGNMSHCGQAFYGRLYGYTYLYESSLNPYIFKNNALAKREASFGICTEYQVPQELLDSNKNSKPQRFDPQAVNTNDKDTLNRVGADPIRKLRRNDRFIGPALLAMKHGKVPFFLARGAAAGFYFVNPEDAAACEIQEFIKENGIEKAVEKYCQLDLNNQEENFLYQLIVANYYDLGDYDPVDVDYMK